MCRIVHTVAGGLCVPLAGECGLPTLGCVCGVLRVFLGTRGSPWVRGTYWVMDGALGRVCEQVNKICGWLL